MKMHLFTIIQLVLLVLLLIIKSTAAALAFPLFVILLVPLRMRGLPKIFTGQELHEVSYHGNIARFWPKYPILNNDINKKNLKKLPCILIHKLKGT